MEGYALLEIGTIIKDTDEVIGGDENDKWKPVPKHLIGKTVHSDWRFPANLKFRRQVAKYSTGFSPISDELYITEIGAKCVVYSTKEKHDYHT